MPQKVRKNNWIQSKRMDFDVSMLFPWQHRLLQALRVIFF